MGNMRSFFRVPNRKRSCCCVSILLLLSTAQSQKLLIHFISQKLNKKTKQKTNNIAAEIAYDCRHFDRDALVD